MKLPFQIASRYLFSRKSHNVINIVSAISAVGMAIGTAALIIILSVYNGFDSLVKSMHSTIEPDYLIVPSQGKYFKSEGPLFDWLYDNPDVLSMCSVLQENVFVEYEGKQGTVLAKGVDRVYMEESRLADYITDGEFALNKASDGRDFVCFGRGFARKMGISPHFISPVNLYFPDAKARYSIINPMACIRHVQVWPSSLFSVSADVDNTLMLMDREVLCSLLSAGDNVSNVEIRLRHGMSKKEERAFARSLKTLAGDEFKALDQYHQNPSLYKMLRYEKAAVYMIMFFVVLILCFCIFSSLSMLIVDKSRDISILRAMGMDNAGIRLVFAMEGVMIAVLGMCAGLAFALPLCLVQQHVGIVPMPANFLVEYYPVIVRWQDIALSMSGITACAALISTAASSKISK